jgi:hypothetical protein
MILKPSLSFAGPREYRWQGLEVPVMMGKRRGTAQITTASPTGCAASNLSFSWSWCCSIIVALIDFNCVQQQFVFIISQFFI